jgi:hypothetical protein
MIDLHTIRQSVRHTWISIVRVMKEGGMLRVCLPLVTESSPLPLNVDSGFYLRV